MNLSRIGEAARGRGGHDRDDASKRLSRRGWLTAATAVLAGACAPEGPAETSGEEEALGQARSAAGNAALPPPERFAAWNQELRQKAPGRDVIFVDLDAVDHNIAVVKSQLGPQFGLRIVTKSLPSLALIDYVLQQAATNRVMAFSEGLLRALLTRFRGGLDILLGRPMPVEGAHRVLKEHPAHGRDVRWLVDTKERMFEYRDLASSVNHCLDVVVEIDVGLRRGGARTTSELLEILDVVAAHPSRLRFAGFMGYDGHVPFAPPGFSSDVEFEEVQERYAAFVQAGAQAHPAMFAGPLVFDGGGSGTYYRYGPGLATPVNSVSMGSAFLLPESFGGLAQLGLVPASFGASPILKKVDPAEVPFAQGYLPWLAQSDPSLEISFYMVAGGFPGDIVYPAGLVPNPFIPEASDGVRSLMPNQAQRLGSSDVPLDLGDHVFYHLWEGNVLGWLNTVEVFRGDDLVDRWATFRDGCTTVCGAP